MTAPLQTSPARTAPARVSPHPLGATLPALYLDDVFAQNLCASLDEVLAPAISVLDCFPAYLDPRTPAVGSTLTAAPRSLRLEFSEHVVLRATHIEVVDGDGTVVPVTGLRLVTADPDDTEEPAGIVATLPRLAQNTYRVSWETLSSDDLHRTSGILVFGVRRAVATGGVSESLPRPE